MPLTQLIYASTPFGFDDLSLTGILGSSRRNNSRDGITGSLICREDLFLQMLEGERAAVAATYERILRDNRHSNVHRFSFNDVPHRLFPDWAMRHDPARSWMWTAEEVSSGVAERTSAEDARDIFVRLASEPPVTARSCPMSA